MKSTAEDISAILSSESTLGLTEGTDLFIGRMQNEPSNCIVIYDLGGRAPMLALKKAQSSYYYSGVSVQVRNNKYAAGYSTIDGIFQYLHGLHGITISGTYYALIKALDNPDILRYDENDRPIFVVNFEVQRK